MCLSGTAKALRNVIGAPGRLVDRDADLHFPPEARARLGNADVKKDRVAERTMPLESAIALALDTHVLGEPERAIAARRNPER